MKKGFTVKEIVNICKAKLYCGQDDIICETFTNDTRKIINKACYIGIKGANFDGSAFYDEAFKKGACAVIIEEEYWQNNSISKSNKPIIIVKNSKKALKELATYKRIESKAKVVGITGSVGKTSTKDMVYSVINKKFKTLKTEGNFNNDIGLPLTLLRLSDEDVAVIEMGMNHLGEIDYLSHIAKPNISIITNVGTAHIGNLGSRENILKAKLEILNGMDKEGILIINNDNDLLHNYYNNLNNKDKIITIGLDNPSDITATDISLAENHSTFNINYQNKTYKVTCNIPGRVFVYNSLIAFAVGILLNIDVSLIIKGISSFELSKNRLEYLKINNNIKVINDAYNASVDSMKSSLEVLGKYKNRKIAVLGDMLELGDYSTNLHEEVGKAVVKNKIDILITVGPNAKNIAMQALKENMKENNIYSFLTNEEASIKIKELLEPNDVVLFKASHGMKLNEIIEKIKI